ncbi:MAG: hypothetical protein WBF43_02230 [Methylocella sp.]
MAAPVPSQRRRLRLFNIKRDVVRIGPALAPFQDHKKQLHGYVLTRRNEPMGTAPREKGLGAGTRTPRGRAPEKPGTGHPGILARSARRAFGLPRLRRLDRAIDIGLEFHEILA